MTLIQLRDVIHVRKVGGKLRFTWEYAEISSFFRGKRSIGGLLEVCKLPLWVILGWETRKYHQNVPVWLRSDGRAVQKLAS